MRVLVTGGTGTLGSHLVRLLHGRCHQVRVLSRSATHGVDHEVVTGDLRSEVDVGRAVEGVDAVIHAATSPRRARSVDVGGTDRLATAVEATGAHLAFVSIVGVDGVRIPYYRAKLEAEERVTGSSAPWTVLRATQFHDLIDRQLFRFPVTVRTRSLRFQPVAPVDVAARLVELVEAGPGGLHIFGGPEILSVEELAQIRRAVTGRATHALRAPAIGPLKDLDAGRHLTPDHTEGHTTWQAWLHEHHA